MVSLLSEKKFQTMHFCNDVKVFLIYVSTQAKKLSGISIVLFGSQARGTAKITSDIDLAIISEVDLTMDKRLEIIEMLEDYPQPMNYQLFFTCVSNLDTDKYFDANYHIKREGVLLCGK